MHATGCVLSISGHHHAGSEPVFDGKATFLCAPALCESPFSFARIELDDNGTVRYETDSFRLPDGFEWFDRHTHTPYAYCGENMDFEVEKELMEMFNLAAAT